MADRISPEVKAERLRIQQEISSALAAILDEEGWSRKTLAKETKVDPVTLWRWLDRGSTIPAWFVVQFCQAVDVGPERVLRPEVLDRELALGKRGALRETAKLLRQVAERMEDGDVPEIAQGTSGPTDQ